jgi:hypothetical protein
LFGNGAGYFTILVRWRRRYGTFRRDSLWL